MWWYMWVGFVCMQPRCCVLLQAKASFVAIARRIGETQRECGLLMPVDDYVDQFKFGLLEVVFEWARGMVSTSITRGRI